MHLALEGAQKQRLPLPMSPLAQIRTWAITLRRASFAATFPPIVCQTGIQQQKNEDSIIPLQSTAQNHV
eukprot:1158592-Pelagomonas_calceolata.AAC.4